MGSFGAALRRTREEKGISIDEIAGETRLSKRYLLALEDEAIHKLPGGTYNRAYLRSYAGYLGLDTERLVREYSLEEAHQTETGRLKPQPDILTSIGKAVENRQSTTGRGRRWNWNPDWITDRRIKMAGLTGLAVLAILLIGGLLWIGLRGFLRETDVATANVSGDHLPAKPITPAESSVALPADEAPESARGAQPPAAGPASEGSRPVPSPATAAPAPVVSEPDAPEAAKEPDGAAPRTPVAGASKARAPARPAGAGRRLSVTGSGVGTGVSNKRLVGESDTFTVGTRVTFWTRVAGGRSGDTVNHVWFHNGVRIGTTSLRVGSADWRTQSRQVLSPDGQWAVEARDADGRVLVRHQFRAAGR